MTMVYYCLQLFQYVQKKKNVFRAVIPRGSKRHSIGPFDTEEEAARAVQNFLKRWDSGEAPVTRGSKREDKHSKHIQNELRARQTQQNR